MISMSERIKIREAYKKYEPILKKHQVSPYGLGIDWFTKFSPIEDRVWDAIRVLGLPLYPQYPVGRFFIDFADPRRMIGIEVDGKAWHQDAEKDARRQAEIESYGWTIYRIPSWMVWKERNDFFCHEDGACYDHNRVLDRERFVSKSAEGFLRDLYRDEPKGMYMYVLGAKS